MARAIIFDMDGLLVYTEEIHRRAYREAFRRRYGIVIDENDFYDHFTREGRRLGEFIELKSLDVNEDELRYAKRLVFKEMVQENLPIAEGAEDVLKRHQGLYPLGLGTSSSRWSADTIMEITGFGKYFDTIVTAGEAPHVKPDPECFALSAKNLGVRPEQCVVVEDSGKGIVAAKSLGMKTVWIPNKITKDEVTSPDVRLDSLRELTPFLVHRL